MRDALPQVSVQVVESVIAEVPSYSEPFRGSMGRNIENAVAVALNGFLDAVAGGVEPRRLAAVNDAAYNLGRGEVRAGRTMDALAAAYRVGTRRAWTDLSAIAVDAGLPADRLADFAAQVFDFLDQLSAVSVSGHADALAEAGRLREQLRAALAEALVAGRAAEELEQLALDAEWPRPRTLTAVLLPQASMASIRSQLDARTLEVSGVAASERWPQHRLLLVPDAGGQARRNLLRSLAGEGVIVGPAKSWTEVASSVARAASALELGLSVDGPLDTEEFLAALVVHADAGAQADLRAAVLAPLAELRPSAADKLTETLRAWLFHQGRRDEIAAALFVHPQTVRYRMGQLREVFGERLDDPAFIRDASVALA
jgi:hypothetical protein